MANDIKHILLSCPEAKKWRMQFLSTKCINANEKQAHRKIINCVNNAQIINLGEYLDKVIPAMWGSVGGDFHSPVLME
jgi:hypothetical protein